MRKRITAREGLNKTAAPVIQYGGFEAIDKLISDHAMLKKNIKRRGLEIDKIIDEIYDDEESAEVLNDILIEMMSIDI